MRPKVSKEHGAVEGTWFRSEQSSIPKNPCKKSQVECCMLTISALKRVLQAWNLSTGEGAACSQPQHWVGGRWRIRIPGAC